MFNFKIPLTSAQTTAEITSNVGLESAVAPIGVTLMEDAVKISSKTISVGFLLSATSTVFVVPVVPSLEIGVYETCLASVVSTVSASHCGSSFVGFLEATVVPSFPG